MNAYVKDESGASGEAAGTAESGQYSAWRNMAKRGEIFGNSLVAYLGSSSGGVVCINMASAS